MKINENSNIGNDVKIIANYLPQYHEIPENNLFWGKGYTDWIAVKNAKPLYDGHCEPRVPLNNNYYSLDEVKTLEWQASLAREYGIYGFGIYHYWFSSKLKLLEKPAELLLSNQQIDINYMFIWDNCSWKRTWGNVKNGNDWAPQFDRERHQQGEQGSSILAELVYGTEQDWEMHFNYLLPFFQDDRYIKIKGMPLFAFMVPSNDFETLVNMVDYWELLAKKAGFPGLY